MSEVKNTVAIIQAGWDDAPWLSEQEKAMMLEATPPSLRDARSKGIPTVGSGNVYPIPVSAIVERPFSIPHYWRRIFGMDVGVKRTAVVWMAINPDTNVKYVYDEYYGGEAPIEVHFQAIKQRGLWIPGVIDPASNARGFDGNRLMSMYRNMGLNIRPADNDVEVGIYKIYNDLASGTMKVFNHLNNFLGEYQLYSRDINGQIIKRNDHLMDAWRYANNSIKFARSMPGNVSQAQRRASALNGGNYVGGFYDYDPLGPTSGGKDDGGLSGMKYDI